jgi:hypothetical protein
MGVWVALLVLDLIAIGVLLIMGVREVLWDKRGWWKK